jgi:hypothetical protein
VLTSLLTSCGHRSQKACAGRNATEGKDALPLLSLVVVPFQRDEHFLRCYFFSSIARPFCRAKLSVFSRPIYFVVPDRAALVDAFQTWIRLCRRRHDARSDSVSASAGRIMLIATYRPPQPHELHSLGSDNTKTNVGKHFLL